MIGSGPTTRALNQLTKEQLVVNQLNRDPAKRHGVDTIMRKVAYNEHVHLTKYVPFFIIISILLTQLTYRKFVSDTMHVHDIGAFDSREPDAKKTHRVPKHPIGIHERWSGDGHDKLYKIGFPIWAMVDDATGKWLDAWVVPSNRLGEVVGYLFLCLVEKYGGEFDLLILISFYLLVTLAVRYPTSVVNRLRLRNHSSIRSHECFEVGECSYCQFSRDS